MDVLFDQHYTGRVAVIRTSTDHDEESAVLPKAGGDNLRSRDLNGNISVARQN